MQKLGVYRVIDNQLVNVGVIDTRTNGSIIFQYAESYCAYPGAIPLSQSLPLSSKQYEEQECKPYFEGLLPEGAAREALAVKVEVLSDQYLKILSSNGLDCIGDVVICAWDQAPKTRTSWDGGSYRPIQVGDISRMLDGMPAQAIENTKSRLSLAGTQGKIGLAHNPKKEIHDGWFQPLGGAASTHVLKANGLSRITMLELICMEAARRCHLAVAQTDAIATQKGIAVCSTRFDRIADISPEKTLHVTRLHQEDMAQAFGVIPIRKYQELPGGSYHLIADLIYDISVDALSDIEQLVRLAIFNYVVGNCDNHLKNLAYVFQEQGVRLAPAYDITCTTCFEKFSREMGMRLGQTRQIDDVTPSDFLLLAKDVGMGSKWVKSICSEVGEFLPNAIEDAGEVFSQVGVEIEYAIDDLLEDIQPRLDILRQVTQ